MLKVATRGRVAQLGERLVRNEEVGGSNPLSSTNFHFPSSGERPGPHREGRGFESPLVHQNPFKNARS